MLAGALAESLSSQRITAMDGAGISSFNQRATERFRLRPEQGACAYEGNIDSAGVVLLLANPGFDSTSTIEDHSFRRVGWPLAGLHPEAPPGLYAWWRKRLAKLVDAFGAQHVSNSVACLQVTPWASTSFTASLCLPSRSLMLQAASACANRGAVMVVMRAEKLWLESDALRKSALRFRVNSWRSAYVSPTNLPAPGWSAIVAAIEA